VDHGPEVLGTRLRHLLDLVDGAVGAVCADLGLPGFRPRYTPVIRLLVDAPLPIRDIAAGIGVTHSAASQTVAMMARDGLVVLTAGDDARRRMVTLTEAARTLLPTLDREWLATTAAARELDAELPYPLSRLVGEALAALRARPMRERIAAGFTESAAPPGPGIAED
jgi:DNA-binding MarR family transcriptional regulator